MSSFLSVRPRRTGACSVRGPLNRIPEPAARRKAQKLEAQGFPAARSAALPAAGAQTGAERPIRRAITGRRGTAISPPPRAAKKQTWNGLSPSAHDRRGIPGSRQVPPQTGTGRPPWSDGGQARGRSKPQQVTLAAKHPPATQPAAGAMAAPLPPACPGRRKAANRLPDSSQMAAKQFRPCRSAAADMNGPRTDAEHPTWTGRRRQAKSRRSRRSGGS